MWHHLDEHVAEQRKLDRNWVLEYLEQIDAESRGAIVALVAFQWRFYGISPVTAVFAANFLHAKLGEVLPLWGLSPEELDQMSSDWDRECREAGLEALSEMAECADEEEDACDEAFEDFHAEHSDDDFEPDRGYLEDREDEENVDTHTGERLSARHDDEDDDEERAIAENEAAEDEERTIAAREWAIDEAADEDAPDQKGHLKSKDDHVKGNDEDEDGQIVIPF